MRIVLCVMLIVISAAIYADEATVYAPRDLAKVIAEGKGTITSSKIDIGKAENAIDGDPSTLARSAAVNPMVITLLLDDPIEVPMMRLRTSDDVHIWTVEAADMQQDLDGKTGSYRIVVDQRRMEKGALDSVRFDKPVKARAFRLTVKRVTGDDYVHIFDWEFDFPARANDIEILALNYFPRDDKLTDCTTTAENTIITLKAFVSPDGGSRMDITPEVNWTVSGGERWMDDPARYILKDPGTVTITADYSGLTKTKTITVTPLTYDNKEPDLDVLYIERLPRIDYDAPNGGWPEAGSTVTWRAHIRNWGEKKIDSVGYQIKMDGGVVSEGAITNFEPETVRTVDWEWKWEKSRHRIACVVDPMDEIHELSERNNTVEDFTDALAVGFYVEERLWRYMHDTQRKLNIESNSFEDWAQRQMSEWNRMHADAIHLGTPQGVLDRVRLDEIIVVPNNSLPMAGGIATNNPNNKDKSVDLIWGFESRDLDVGGWEGFDLSDANANYISWGHMHELNHARYIIDSYGFDVHPSQVHILDDDGKPIVGGSQFPAEGVLHYDKYQGLMGGPHVYDEYVALAWNRVAGQRARGGNYNGPSVIGEYIQLFPKRNTFTFVDKVGAPLVGADVWIYRSTGNPTQWYGKDFDNIPDVHVKLDDRGQVDLEKTIFADDGVLRHDYGDANTVVILKIVYAGRTRYEFLEVSDFNVEYMRGHTEHGHYTVTVGG